jgi:hypothetical protein
MDHQQSSQDLWLTMMHTFHTLKIDAVRNVLDFTHVDRHPVATVVVTMNTFVASRSEN